MESTSNTISELIWAYERSVCEQASLVASEIRSSADEDELPRALRSYISLMFEGVRYGHAFREARDFLLTQAVHRGVSPVEVSMKLTEKYLYEEIVVRACLRSIATMARDLETIESCRINWHKLHGRFKEAASGAYSIFSEGEQLLEAAYA
ncbi:MAG: hypothetical protein QF415_05810 [Candidatus Undinarchaeales archaeon]|jgi:hypothetical protein|nr:hypothetical protein [Candidatus Undinarchaeales archaeon]MDP7491635.1 hypothetical protein [Candidatus Undinarchaeales archaeon]